MKLRKIIFWLHLTAGVVAGTVILVMSVTGVLLAFECQIVAFGERDIRTVMPPASNSIPRLSLCGKPRAWNWYNAFGFMQGVCGVILAHTGEKYLLCITKIGQRIHTKSAYLAQPATQSQPPRQPARDMETV